MEEYSSKKNMDRWKNGTVYILSSLCIVLAMVIIMYIKKFWPFGDYAILDGDVVMQGWPSAAELRNKLLSGESLFYSWNAGFGTNYYSNLAFYLNPWMLLFAMIPVYAMLQTSNIIYILTLVLCNISMLYYLTHRPELALECGDITNILFSISYSMCIYVIANANNWNFMITAALYPIVILGLENAVYNKGWKLYYFSFALAFLSNYYFTGLFCFFIILYYLTLTFDGIKDFIKKTLRILGISVLAIGTTGLVIVPVVVQLFSQTYSVSSYAEKTWFTNYFDIIQYFFAFNQSIGMGSTSKSYGEVSLYMGLLPLLLATMYFLNTEITWKVRIRKLFVFVIYLLAFNLNGLNYVMHLFHYPSWYPNRFSWFFVLYCIILACENWISITNNKKIMLRAIIESAGIWYVFMALCRFFSTKRMQGAGYGYSAIFLFLYVVFLLYIPYGKEVIRKLCVAVGCAELLISFSYSFLVRTADISIPVYVDTMSKLEAALDCEKEEAYGFSRILSEGDLLLSGNTGMLLNYKSPTIFSSTINNIREYVNYAGVLSGGNYMLGEMYSPAVMSMLNIQYIFKDNSVLDIHTMQSLYPERQDVYDDYPMKRQTGNVILYENPDVLSLGYMIKADTEFTDKDDLFDNINHWVENACGVAGVFETSELRVVDIEAYNCQAVVTDNNILIAYESDSEDLLHKEAFGQDGGVFDVDTVEYNAEQNSTIVITYEADTAGDYYVQIDKEICGLGFLEKGEQGRLVYSRSPEKVEPSILYNVTANVVVFQTAKWQQAYDRLTQQQMSVEKYSSGQIAGVIEAEEPGVLFTSIPYDPGWQVFVDGKEIEIQPLYNKTFLGIQLEKGVHEVRFAYHQKGFATGIILTAACFLMATVLQIFTYKKNDEKSKNDQSEETTYIIS